MNTDLHLPKKKLYKILNLISFLVLISMPLYLILTWKSIPDTLPTHFNGIGEADAWGGKGSLILLPVLAILIYGMITLLEHLPDVWNTGVKLTPQNQNRVLTAVYGMIVTTKLSMLLLFAWLNFCSAKCMNLGKWFTSISLSIVFGPMIYYIIKIYHTPSSEKH